MIVNKMSFCLSCLKTVFTEVQSSTVVMETIAKQEFPYEYAPAVFVSAVLVHYVTVTKNMWGESWIFCFRS